LLVGIFHLCEIPCANPKSQLPKRKSRIAFYLLALGLFALGLMSKPMLVTWPFLLLVMDFWPLRRVTDLQGGRKKNRRITFRKNPSLACPSCLLTMWAQKGRCPLSRHFPLSYRAPNVLTTYAEYILKLWPTKLSVFYPFRPQLGTVWRQYPPCC
jgi:hypothetical protein